MVKASQGHSAATAQHGQHERRGHSHSSERTSLSWRDEPLLPRHLQLRPPVLPLREELHRVRIPELALLPHSTQSEQSPTPAPPVTSTSPVPQSFLTLLQRCPPPPRPGCSPCNESRPSYQPRESSWWLLQASADGFHQTPHRRTLPRSKTGAHTRPVHTRKQVHNTADLPEVTESGADGAYRPDGMKEKAPR